MAEAKQCIATAPRLDVGSINFENLPLGRKDGSIGLSGVECAAARRLSNWDARNHGRLDFFCGGIVLKPKKLLFSGSHPLAHTSRISISSNKEPCIIEAGSRSGCAHRQGA